MGDGPGLAGANVRYYTDTITQGLPGWMGIDPAAGRYGETMAHACRAIKRRIEDVRTARQPANLDTIQLPPTAYSQQPPYAPETKHCSFAGYRGEEVCYCANYPAAMEASVRAHDFPG